jgi:hypothetical protein
MQQNTDPETSDWFDRYMLALRRMITEKTPDADIEVEKLKDEARQKWGYGFPGDPGCEHLVKSSRPSRQQELAF